MSKKNRFGSPYDPTYRGTGKITRPQEQSEAEQHRLRGCGDPNCAMCNPETAARGGNNVPNMNPGRTVSIDIESNPFSGRSFGAIREEMIRQMMGSMNSGGFIRGDGMTSTNAKPSSYTQARRAVEQWIIEAPEQAFDDIVGNEDALGSLRDAITAPVEHKDLYAAYGMKMPKGALLSGPPGCGKTMFARAAASEMKHLYGGDHEFISVSGSELQSMYVGETEGRIKAIFTYAREYKKFHGHPLLVFMDEAETLLPDRTGRVRRVAPWEESQVATFLAEMDGMQESGAFVLLATNRPEVIDQAVLRDGRCDFKIVVKRPTMKALEVILQKGFEKLPKRGAGVAELTFAALESFRDPHKIITEAHAIKLGSFDGRKFDTRDKSFTLEHIVSGAMAASVPARATRHAFARDKSSGDVTGVQVEDVLKAVNDLFAENRDLDHSFAMGEFLDEFAQEVQAEEKRKMN